MKRSPSVPRSRRWMSAVSMMATLAGASRVHAVPRLASRDAQSPSGVPRTARYLIDVGSFTPNTSAASGLCSFARDALVGRLSSDASVVVGDAGRDPGAVERMLRRHHLRGYLIDGGVRVVSAGGASRVEVSLLVQTNPGREYRFESAVSVTLSGGTDAQRGVELEDATRRAVLSAMTRAMGQLASE